MSRFLFVVPPLAGHTNPTVSVAAELERRGHDVAWVGHARALREHLPALARRFEIADELPAEMLRAIADQSQRVRGLSALRFLWKDFFVPLARSMLGPVEAAARTFSPNVLVVDQQALAGALVARRLGIPFATFATTSASIVDPLAAFPKVKRELDEMHAALEREAGLPASELPDLSPSLVVVFSSRALVGDARAFPAHFRFVGPAFGARPPPPEFPWDAPLRSPLALVTLGTVNADRGERFFREALAAVRNLGWSAVFVARPDVLGALPENIVAAPRVPQLELLPRVDVVVCHAGHNTVCEALAHDKPLLVAPIIDDQSVVAQQVADAGAGLRVKFGRVTAMEIASALSRLRDEATFREAAARIGASLRAAGGASAAADALEELR
jgi:MGT family glycosyltransferase